jgi:hypothetical protein
MINRPSRPANHERLRKWSPLSIVTASIVLFVALGGTAVAANSLIRAGNIAPGAVTSKAIRNGGIELWDLSATTRASLQVGEGLTGAKGETGATGAPGTGGSNGANGANGANGPNGVDGVDGSSGADGVDGTDGADGATGADGDNGTDGIDGTNGVNGANGANGPNGIDGTNGVNGANGANGPNGANGANGANGVDGTDGADGANGLDGTDGVNGTDGTDGTITPLSAKQGLTPLPTASPPTTVVELVVPAGTYVVLAKTQLSHTGAGDSIDCTLKSGGATIDQVAMKTLPALAAIPVSMQAVTTTASTSQLSVECKVQVANGTANFSSLIAIPTGQP